MNLTTDRLRDIEKYGSYFEERQLRVMNELAAYVNQHGEMPTAEKLAVFAKRPWIEVRSDLRLVNLEGFVWVFGVEDEAAAA